MKIILILTLAILLLIPLTPPTIKAGANTALSPSNDWPLPADADGELPFLPGRVLVQFQRGTSARRARAIMSAHRALAMQKVSNAGLHLMRVEDGVNERELIEALRLQPEVEFAELDYLIPPAEMTPNDPSYQSEWHLPKISAASAWATISGSSNVIIAILDTGVDGTHPDLAPKMVAGWNFFDNNSDTRDVYGHGTAVAGTAAAATNNSLGVASVAWGCRIMPIRVASSNGSASLSAMASGLAWAADHGARVANISYKVTNYSTVTTAAQYFQSQGGVVVIAAGNNRLFDATPDNPYALTVSATTAGDYLASFSNTGNNIDLAAPGESIQTTNNGGGYSAWSGTSFSAPIVAGVAALVVSANPTLNAGQIQDVLKNSSDDLGATGWDPDYGSGRVNASRAVDLALGINIDHVAPTISVLSPAEWAVLSGTASISAAASDNLAVTAVQFSADGAVKQTATSAPYTFSWDTTTAESGQHTITFTAYDAAGNWASASVFVVVDNRPETTPPQVTIQSPTNGQNVAATTVVTVSVTAVNPVTQVELYVDGVLKSASTAAPFYLKWVARKAPVGVHTLQCVAYDIAGNTGISPVVTVIR